MEPKSLEKPPSIGGRLRGLFNRGGARPASVPASPAVSEESKKVEVTPPAPFGTGNKITVAEEPSLTRVNRDKPADPTKIEASQAPEKEPEPWFVVDGDNRREMRRLLEGEAEQKEIFKEKWQEAYGEYSKQAREKIEERNPIKLFTPQDGEKLLKALNQAVGDTRLNVDFVRSDGKTVRVKDYGTTGIIIEIPEELETIHVIAVKGPYQCLSLGAAAYLWAQLQFKLQDAGVRLDLDTEGITVETSKGYDFSPERKAEILKKVTGKGRGRLMLVDYYNGLAQSPFPQGRRELGAAGDEKLRLLEEPPL